MAGARQGGGRRPGMMDVARLAGVSHQTVSRVLNAPETVRPATLERVRAAIDELGYRRNMAARALVTDSTRTVGVIAASSAFYGPASTAAAIEGAARSAGYACLVVALQDESPDAIGQVLDFLVQRGVDGIIAVAPQTWMAEAARATTRDLPIVVVADGCTPSERLHVVSVDQELGARLAVGHLIESGARSVWHLAGPLDWYDAAARVRGWRAALEDAGLVMTEPVPGDWSPECGHELGERLTLLPAQERPDAVFCSNDLMSLGLMSALVEGGVEVPGAVRVVGYDDIAGAAYFTPSLSSVRQPFGELGRLALEVLLRAIGGEEGAAHSIAPELVVRRSSAAPKD